METWLSSSPIHLENELNQISLQIYLNLSCYCTLVQKCCFFFWNTWNSSNREQSLSLPNKSSIASLKKKSLCLMSIAPMWPFELHSGSLSRLISQSALMTYKHWYGTALRVSILSTFLTHECRLSKTMALTIPNRIFCPVVTKIMRYCRCC